MLASAHIVVLVTVSSIEEGERIAKRILEEKLAACVNIIGSVKSFFWWEGKVDEACESLLVIKTRLDKLEKLVETIKELHSYEVPEIIAIPIIGGLRDYLKWIDDSVS